MMDRAAFLTLAARMRSLAQQPAAWSDVILVGLTRTEADHIAQTLNAEAGRSIMQEAEAMRDDHKA